MTAQAGALSLLYFSFSLSSALFPLYILYCCAILFCSILFYSVSSLFMVGWLLLVTLSLLFVTSLSNSPFYLLPVPVSHAFRCHSRSTFYMCEMQLELFFNETAPSQCAIG